MLQFKATTSSGCSVDGDTSYKIVPLCDRVFDVDRVTIIGILGTGERCGILRPLVLSHGRMRARLVVLRVDLHASIVRDKAGPDIAPPFVVVDSKDSDELGARRLFAEAKRTGGAAAAHFQDLCFLEVEPPPAVGVMPDSFLHYLEPSVVLNDIDFDGVRHL